MLLPRVFSYGIMDFEDGDILVPPVGFVKPAASGRARLKCVETHLLWSEPIPLTPLTLVVT